MFVSPTEDTFRLFMGDVPFTMNEEAARLLSQLARSGVVWVTQLSEPPAFPGLTERVAGKSVLSLGSLEGNLEWHLARAGAARVVGVEGYSENYRKCLVLKALFPSLPLEFVLGDAQKLDVPGTFDVIVCAGVLYHLHDPALLLENLRAMKPERMFLSTQTAIDPGHAAFDRLALGAVGETSAATGFYRGRWWSDYRSNIHDYRCGLDGRDSFWLYADELRRLLRDLEFDVLDWKVVDFDDQGRIAVGELAAG